MAKKKDYHVVPNSSGWSVKREGNQKASSLHETKQEAVDAGKDLAKKAETELVIHRKNGTIQDSDSYGNDPCPPRDKKH